MNKPSFLLAALLSATLMNTAQAETDSNLVDSIMSLRADVESLYSKVQDNKDAHKAQMKSFAMQKADLEAQINRKETALKQLALEIENTSKEIEEASSKNEDIKPLLLAALSQLKTEVNQGLPFKLHERNSDLDKIQSQLESGAITPERALSQLWASYEDALRLTKENGLFKQEITLDGEEKLAEVAKLGSIMLFFRTPDGQLGFVKKNDAGVNYVVADKESDQKHITALFDALKKQIRTGYFTLPNALVLMEGK
ncbi:MAG: DUF3450 family protein [Thiotrichales bacterium]